MKLLNGPVSPLIRIMCNSIMVFSIDGNNNQSDHERIIRSSVLWTYLKNNMVNQVYIILYNTH